MTDREAFKFAFLMECARDGLDRDEAAAMIGRLERLVAGGGEKRAHPALDVIKSVLGGAGGMAWGLAKNAPALVVGGTALAGGAAGYTAAKLNEGTFDEEAAKKQELIAAYNSFSDEARALKKNRHAGPAIRVPIR